jgi:hypothetical protein
MNRRRAIVVVACALVALMLAVVMTSRESEESDSTPVAGRAAEEADASNAATDSTASGGSLPLRSGETLAVSREELVSGVPLVLQLQLGESEVSRQPLAGRILAEGRVLELSAAVRGEAADVAEVEIEADWLEPGRFIIEIQTSERSHFPLRRYVIEVR